MGGEQLAEYPSFTRPLGQGEGDYMLDLHAGQVTGAGHQLGDVRRLGAEQERQPESVLEHELGPEPLPDGLGISVQAPSPLPLSAHGRPSALRASGCTSYQSWPLR